MCHHADVPCPPPEGSVVGCCGGARSSGVPAACLAGGSRRGVTEPVRYIRAAFVPLPAQVRRGLGARALRALPSREGALRWGEDKNKAATSPWESWPAGLSPGSCRLPCAAVTRAKTS